MKYFLFLVALATWTLAQEVEISNSRVYSNTIDPVISTGIANSVKPLELLNKKSIIHERFYFEQGVLTEESQKRLDAFIDIAVKTKGYIAIIGNSSSDYVDPNLDVNLNGWSTFWQSLGTIKQSKERQIHSVNSKIKTIYNAMKKSNIQTSRIYTENRLDRDPISSEATSEGRALNNRVEVTLYY